VDCTRLSPVELLRTCIRCGSTSSWQEFISRYNSVIHGAAIRSANRWGRSSSVDVEDIVQEIYLKICTHEAGLSRAVQAGTPEVIIAYLRVIATNAAHDYFRSKAAAKRGGTVTDQFPEHLQPRAGTAVVDLERRLTLEKIEQIVVAHTRNANGIRDRAIFQLYYRQGLTAKAIAALPGVNLSIKGVEGVVHRLVGIVRKELKSAEGIHSGLRVKEGGP